MSNQHTRPALHFQLHKRIEKNLQIVQSRTKPDKTDLLEIIQHLQQDCARLYDLAEKHRIASHLMAADLSDEIHNNYTTHA